MDNPIRPATLSKMALSFAFASTALTGAAARVQDYQILRTLSDRTSCQTEGLEAQSKADGSIAYHATCGNVTFYPSGVDIVCTDHEDERSCRITTSKKDFDQLELLRRK